MKKWKDKTHFEFRTSENQVDIRVSHSNTSSFHQTGPWVNTANSVNPVATVTPPTVQAARNVSVTGMVMPPWACVTTLPESVTAWRTRVAITARHVLTDFTETQGKVF